jgi:hypothetical protein
MATACLLSLLLALRLKRWRRAGVQEGKPSPGGGGFLMKKGGMNNVKLTMFNAHRKVN